MSTITVETACGTRQWYDNRQDAEASRTRHRERCDECGEGDVRVAVDPDQSTLRALAGEDDGHPDDGAASGTETASQSVPGSNPGRLAGSAFEERVYPAVAEYTDIAVQAEAITTAGETDHAYAEFRATAWRKDEGRENGYTGHATARAAEGRPGIEHRLNEVAETRAMRRAVAWASGCGPATGEEADRPREETTASPEGV